MVNEEEEEERKRQKIVKNINVAFRFFVWRLKKLLLVLTLVWESRFCVPPHVTHS